MGAQTICGAAQQQGLSFLPLRGERDEQREFGLTIPLYGWTFDVSNFRTGARNFFDHDALGNSNIFFPLTLIAHASMDGRRRLILRVSLDMPSSISPTRISMWKDEVASPAASRIFAPSEDNSCFFLDHDQRDTLSLASIWTCPGERLPPST